MSNLFVNGFHFNHPFQNNLVNLKFLLPLLNQFHQLLVLAPVRHSLHRLQIHRSAVMAFEVEAKRNPLLKLPKEGFHPNLLCHHHREMVEQQRNSSPKLYEVQIEWSVKKVFSHLAFDLSETLLSAQNFLQVIPNLLNSHPGVEQMTVVHVPVLLRVEDLIYLLVVNDVMDGNTFKSRHSVKYFARHFSRVRSS